MATRNPFARHSFVALQHRNVRLIWIGLFVSFAGSTMQNAALLWHVSLLVPTDKALALGMVGLVRVVPIVVFSMISGVVADAWRHRTACWAACWASAWCFSWALGELEAGAVANCSAHPSPSSSAASAV